MKPGSVIVDLAAVGGGNCEYTVPGEVFTTANGVKVVGYTDLANRLSGQSYNCMPPIWLTWPNSSPPGKDGNIVLNEEDVIVRNMTVTQGGEIKFPPPPIQVSAQPQAVAKVAPVVKAEPTPVPTWKSLACGRRCLGDIVVGAVAPAAFLNHFIVFVLSCVVGYYVVWNVSHSLHTPLMSVTNAISGIVVLGAVLQIGQGNGWVSVLAFIAVLLVSVNIFGGFYVTRRMLNMFRKR